MVSASVQDCGMPEKQIKESDLTKMFPPSPTAAFVIGKVFDRLTVVGYAGSRTRIDKHGHKIRGHFVRCRCSCGNRDIANPTHLIHGLAKSCGCLSIDIHTKRLTKHGYAPLHGKRRKSYVTWQSMNNRCHNKGNSHYKFYGGRGIKICDRWLGKNGFVNFLSDMGEPEKGMSIERKDVNGDYEPSNCCWVPHKDQAKNRNHNWMVEVCGVVLTAREAGRRLGFGRGRIDAFLKRSGKDKTEIHDIAPILKAFGVNP